MKTPWSVMVLSLRDTKFKILVKYFEERYEDVWTNSQGRYKLVS